MLFSLCEKIGLLPSSCILIVSSSIIFTLTLMILLGIPQYSLLGIFLPTLILLITYYLRPMMSEDFIKISNQIKKKILNENISFSQIDYSLFTDNKPFLIKHHEKQGQYIIKNIGNIYREGTFAHTYMLLLCYALYLEYKENKEFSNSNQLTIKMNSIISGLEIKTNHKIDLKFFVRLFMSDYSGFDLSSLIQNQGYNNESAIDYLENVK